MLAEDSEPAEGLCPVTLLYMGTTAAGFVAVLIVICESNGVRASEASKSWISAIDQPVAKQQPWHEKPGLYQREVQPLLALRTRKRK